MIFLLPRKSDRMPSGLCVRCLAGDPKEDEELGSTGIRVPVCSACAEDNRRLSRNERQIKAARYIAGAVGFVAAVLAVALLYPLLPKLQSGSVEIVYVGALFPLAYSIAGGGAYGLLRAWFRRSHRPHRAGLRVSVLEEFSLLGTVHAVSVDDATLGRSIANGLPSTSVVEGGIDEAITRAKAMLDEEVQQAIGASGRFAIKTGEAGKVFWGGGALILGLALTATLFFFWGQATRSDWLFGFGMVAAFIGGFLLLVWLPLSLPAALFSQNRVDVDRERLRIRSALRLPRRSMRLADITGFDVEVPREGFSRVVLHRRGGRDVRLPVTAREDGERITSALRLLAGLSVVQAGSAGGPGVPRPAFSVDLGESASPLLAVAACVAVLSLLFSSVPLVFGIREMYGMLPVMLSAFGGAVATFVLLGMFGSGSVILDAQGLRWRSLLFRRTTRRVPIEAVESVHVTGLVRVTTIGAARPELGDLAIWTKDGKSLSVRGNWSDIERLAIELSRRAKCKATGIGPGGGFQEGASRASAVPAINRGEDADGKV